MALSSDGVSVEGCSGGVGLQSPRPSQIHSGVVSDATAEISEVNPANTTDSWREHISQSVGGTM